MNTVPSHIYHLGRLGVAGDRVVIDATDDERAAIAQLANLVRLPRFSGTVDLKKLSATRYRLDYTLTADPVQACVVTLADVPEVIEKTFTRELHFSAVSSRAKADIGDEIIITPEEDGQPEEIDSLQFDLAAPLLEEFLLALEPYPRAPGVVFAPPEAPLDGPENPFAALKGLKSRL